MSGYIRKFLAAGLCFATATLCMPAQLTYAVNAKETDTPGITAGAAALDGSGTAVGAAASGEPETAAGAAASGEPGTAVRAAGSEDAGAAPEEISITDDTVAVPTVLSAPVLTAESVGYNSAKLVWNAVENGVSYELQQSADKKNYTTLVTLTSGQELSYHAQDLYTGTNTFFRVIVTGASGAKAISARLKVKPAMTAPAVTKMEPNGSNKVDLAWTAVEGADFYRVYRSKTQTGGYTRVKTVYETSYTNTVPAVGTYYYKIMPMRYNPDGKKVRGKCSAPQSVKLQTDAPTITSVTNSAGNSLTVAWSAVKNAAGYAVYRSLEKSSGYKLVKELDKNTLTWTDTAVEAGTIYYYKVSAALSAGGTYGTKSAAKSKWTVSDAPGDLKAVQDGGGNVKLSWTATKGTTSYTIYRAQGGGDFAQIAIKVTGTSYTDSGLIAGESYSYQIEAVHGSLVSERSKAVTVTLGELKVNTRTLYLGPGVSRKLTAASEISGGVTWTSEDPSVATVDGDGTVTGVAAGKTTVYAEIEGVTAPVTVTVTDCRINGIDVSKWQQAIDWKTVKASGIQFAMLRATYGTSVDNQFETYYSGATQQGIKVGVYCYTRAKNVEEGIAEAEYLIKLLDGRKLDYPVALDLEDELQIKNMNKAARTELILEYKRIVEEAGYQFVVYSNLNWLTNYIDQSKLEEENVDIWIARYRTQSLGHGYDGGGDVTMWQYSSTGQVDGILDAYGRYINVDLDVSYEDY